MFWEDMRLEDYFKEVYPILYITVNLTEVDGMD